jgi:type IX secretion system PorP/SprF family membrane protein
MKKMNSFKATLVIASVCFSFIGNTQGDPSYRQNQFNVLMFNPAQAGANNYSDISTLASNQWIGMPGAPVTYTASGNFKVFDNFGVGVSVLADKYGPVKLNKSDVNLAYHLRLSKNWKLGVGVKISMSDTYIDMNEIQTIVGNDPAMMSSLRTGFALNSGYGALVYNKYFYAGFSQPRIGKTSFLNQDMTQFVDTKSGIIAYVGANIPINAKVDFRPNIVSRYVKNTPYNLDINTIFTMNKVLDLGVSYQLSAGIGLIMGYEFKQKFYVGYSYSYPVNSLNRVAKQSHEIALRYRFAEKSTRSQSPRFFF